MIRHPPRSPLFPYPPLSRSPPGATPAASPASPPPITITFFKDVLFRVVAETGLGHEYHFFRFGEADFFAKDGEAERFDTAEQPAVGMHQEPESATAVRLNQGDQG